MSFNLTGGGDGGWSIQLFAFTEQTDPLQSPLLAPRTKKIMGIIDFVLLQNASLAAYAGTAQSCRACWLLGGDCPIQGFIGMEGGNCPTRLTLRKSLRILLEIEQYGATVPTISPPFSNLASGDSEALQ